MTCACIDVSQHEVYVLTCTRVIPGCFYFVSVLHCFPCSSVPWVGLILCQGAELETVGLCQYSRSHAGVAGLSSAAARNAAGQLSGMPAEC